VATIYKRLTEDGKVRYTAYIRLKGHPGNPDLRPEGRRHPMDQAARNRRPDRALPAQPEVSKRTLADLIDRYTEHVLPDLPASARDYAPAD
jgi:hypothetical protein